MTPATRSRGPTDPVIWITPDSVTWSQQRRTGSFQTNLFSGTPEDPVAGFRHRVRELAAKLEEQAKETRSGFEAEEDPIGEEDEEEEEEEEEDPGSSDAYDSREDEDDDDPPLASSHRPVTQSTPKKPVSRLKRKAYRTKGSGPGSSSRKRSRESRE